MIAKTDELLLQKAPQPMDPAPDLAFLRRLAEDGRAMAGITGHYLILWGLLVAAANLVHFFALLWDRPSWPGTAYAVMSVIGWAGSFWFSKKDARRRVTNVATRVFASVFAACGVTISVYVIAALTSPYLLPQSIPMVAAMLTGLCFIAGGGVTRSPAFYLLGAAWLASAGVFAFLLTSVWLYAVAVIVWLLFLAGPGFWLRYKRPAG